MIEDNLLLILVFGGALVFIILAFFISHHIRVLKNELLRYKYELKNFQELEQNHQLLSEDYANLKEELSLKRQKLALYEQKADELSSSLDVQSQKLENLQLSSTADKELIASLQTKLDEQEKAMSEKLKLFSDNEQKLKLEFENLANKIFTENSKKFTEQNQQNLGTLLSPVKEQLGEFKKQVEDVYIKESKERSVLQHELKNLKELNLKMSEDAQNLTNALKNDNKTQGLWGEMVLERVLENSGLREGYEYRREVSLKDDENKTYRPDVIVDLPDHRHIIIDAKTSLVAYNNYVSSKNEKELFLSQHIRSIKEHIKLLSEKRYEALQGVNSLDFIFMFVPIEGALLVALDHDSTLYDEAFKKKIILVSPTTLLVALRAVENTWRYEKQAQNITDVYKRSEELYKKFVGFVEDLEKVGRALKQADESYLQAYKKLSSGKGNLINQATMLKNISNIKPKKELSAELEEQSLLD